MCANNVAMARIGQGADQGASLARIGVSPVNGNGFSPVGGGVRCQNNMPEFWISLWVSHCCVPWYSDIPIIDRLGVFGDGSHRKSKGANP